MANPDYIMPSVAGGHRKPKTNIYTLLLIIALVALLVGCLFFYLEIRRIGGFSAIPRLSAVTAPVNIQLAQVALNPALVDS